MLFLHRREDLFVLKLLDRLEIGHYLGVPKLACRGLRELARRDALRLIARAEFRSRVDVEKVTGLYDLP